MPNVPLRRRNYLRDRIPFGSYDALGEVKAFAIAADEAATMLPATSSAKHKRILARLYTLVSQTANRAGWALEKSEDMVAQFSAHETVRAAKRSRERRAR